MKKIIAMYAGDDGQGDSGFSADHYRWEVSADFISTVTHLGALEKVVEVGEVAGRKRAAIGGP